MRGKNQIAKLRDVDVYSVILFALYKIKDIPEYSTLSELAYILDKNSMLKLCEYFGGMTLKIPTIDELETLIYSLLLYQMVDVDGKTYDEAISVIGAKSIDLRAIKSGYEDLKKVLEKYSFSNRGEADG